MSTVIKTDVVVLGAGAAGMICAVEAGRRGRSVTVIDHARTPGEKSRISGGGRCNFYHSLLQAATTSSPATRHFAIIGAQKSFNQQDGETGSKLRASPYITR